MRRILVAAAHLLLAAAVPLHAAISYTSVTKAEGQKGAELANSVVQAWFDGTSARLEFKQSQNPLMPKGSYLLTGDGGATFLLVNPAQKTFAKWSIKEMLGMAGGAMQMARGLMKMKFSAPQVEKLLEEPGGEIVGFSTTHYRYRTSYTMEMSFFGRTMKSSTVNEEDIWSTTGLDAVIQSVWRQWQAPSTGDPEFDRLIEAEYQKAAGTPLRRIIFATTEDGQGKKTVTKTTMEVTEFSRSAVPPVGALSLPPGYKEIEPLGFAMPGAKP